MSADPSAITQTVQNSVVNVFKLVEVAAAGQGNERIEALKGEAQKTILMFIVAIVLADDKYSDGERAFVNLLLDWGEKRAGEMEFLHEYATAWRAASLQLPDFFETALDYDKSRKTNLAADMLRELQMIGNCASVSDGEFEAREHDVVHHYTMFLEQCVAAWKNDAAPSDAANGDDWLKV